MKNGPDDSARRVVVGTIAAFRNVSERASSGAAVDLAKVPLLVGCNRAARPRRDVGRMLGLGRLGDIRDVREALRLEG